jgi:uncharacterized DUF497 family protein
MEFEFNPRKSRANLAKHGIDLVVAQEIWDDPDLLEIPANTEDEPRWVVIGRIGSKHWSAVITYRSEAVRILSVRRSRADEEICMKARKFDSDFAAGKSVIRSLDLAQAKRPKQEQRRVNVDFPTWMIEQLDREAGRLGVTRQSIIKVWLAERLGEAASNNAMQADGQQAGRR